MSAHKREVKLPLNVSEFNFIFDFQLANKPQLEKLLLIKSDLLEKRPDFKRVNIVLTLGDINSLLVNISREANKGNMSADNQHLLDTLFSKLSSKYNENMYA